LVALRLDLELLELGLQVCELPSEGLRRLVAALHRVVQLVFQARNLLPQLLNRTVQLHDVAHFEFELLL